MRTEMKESLAFTTVALMAVALIALIAACSGDAADENSGEEAMAHIESADDELVIDMTVKDMKFVPDTMTVKVGQTVRLTVENLDPILHDYSVDEPEFLILEAVGAQHDHGDHDAMEAGDHDAMEADDHDAMEADHDATEAHDDDHGHDGEQVSAEPLHIAAEANGEAELVFEATDSGEYVFYCSVPGHREAGMEGTIIIEE